LNSISTCLARLPKHGRGVSRLRTTKRRERRPWLRLGVGMLQPQPVIAGPLFRFDLQTNTRSPAVAAEILRRRIADERRLVSTRAQERYALIPIVSTPLYAPEAPPVTIGVCAAICLGVLSAKTSSRSTLTEVKFVALAP
jgi:hypothetical protein